MPTLPLIDPASLEALPLVADRAAILSRIKQRGRFALLDGIVLQELEPARIVGYKDIRADDWWAADHIPGRPIFPGALMCEAAAQLSTYDYVVRSQCPPETFLGFGGLDEVRFRGIVEPGVRMFFAAQPVRMRSRMFTYAAQGYVRGELVFEAQIMGVIV